MNRELRKPGGEPVAVAGLGGGEQLASEGMEGRDVREILTVYLFLCFLVLEPRKHFSYSKN